MNAMILQGVYDKIKGIKPKKIDEIWQYVDSWPNWEDHKDKSPDDQPALLRAAPTLKREILALKSSTEPPKIVQQKILDIVKSKM